MSRPQPMTDSIMQDHYDGAVIGSGAGGAPIAYELDRFGMVLPSLSRKLEALAI
jgi:choline dehydrogenase-like flavoprotein